MKNKKSKLTFLIPLILLNVLSAFGQPCGPNFRHFDRITLSPTGDILILKANFYGDLMDCFDNKKSISFNYVIFSKNGQMLIDSVIYLLWPEWHYDFIDCKASYKYNTPTDKKFNEPFNIKPGNCSVYSLNSIGNKCLISYYLKCDRKFAYELIIDSKGKSNYSLYNTDSLDVYFTSKSKGFKYHDEFSKYNYWNYYLGKKYKNISILKNNPFYYDTTKQIIKIDSSDVFLSLSELSLADTMKFGRPDKWVVKGNNWEIPLDGFLIYNYINPPLITKSNEMLYITVFNSDGMSCAGYGWDILPILYAIDMDKGKIVWQKELP